jgi:hypothetical protein
MYGRRKVYTLIVSDAGTLIFLTRATLDDIQTLLDSPVFLKEYDIKRFSNLVLSEPALVDLSDSELTLTVIKGNYLPIVDRKVQE